MANLKLAGTVSTPATITHSPIGSTDSAMLQADGVWESLYVGDVVDTMVVCDSGGDVKIEVVTPVEVI